MALSNSKGGGIIFESNGRGQLVSCLSLLSAFVVDVRRVRGCYNMAAPAVLPSAAGRRAGGCGGAGAGLS